MISKYDHINFPLFGFKDKPSEIKLGLSTIQIRKNPQTHLETLDDKKLSGTYFERLLQLKTRAVFDVTCTNIQDCLLSNVKWGVDCLGYMHDLSNKEKVIQKIEPIVKVKHNFIWVKNISYPFKINTNDVLEVKDRLYVQLLYIKNEWFIYKFLEEKIEIKRYCYI